MSNEEHYFENLIHHGSDEVADNCNRDNIKPEVREVIETCYYYVLYNLFRTRENLDEFLEEDEHETTEEKYKPESCDECTYHQVDGLFDYCDLDRGMLLMDNNTDYEKQRDPNCPLN